VAVEGLDVERAEGGVDVVRREGCTMGMTREARCFLVNIEYQRTCERSGVLKSETKREDVLARPGVYGIPRRSPAFPRFRREGCYLEFRYFLLLPMTRTKKNTSVNNRSRYDQLISRVREHTQA